MPKKVHTVSIRPDRETVGQAPSAELSQPALAQSDAGLSDRADAIPAKPVTTGAASAPPLAAPLKMWAMFPDDAGGWNSTAEPPKAGDVKPAAPKHAAHTPHRTAAAKHVTHHKRRLASHRTRHRHTRTAATKPQPAQQAEAPAETQAAATQPVKKLPLQAALDKLFGNAQGDASNSASSDNSVAPATTGRAAFR